MSCFACEEQIIDSTESIVCNSGCKNIFHFSCAGFDEKFFRNLPKKKKENWKCVSCHNVKVPSLQSNDQQLQSSITDLGLQVKFDDLKSFISSKMNEFTVSLEFNSNLIQNLTTNINALKKKTDDLEVSNKDLINENSEMKTEIGSLKQEITDLKQYSRNTNIEISNLPESENENLPEIVSKIENYLDLKFSDKISAIHRVPTFQKDRTRPIIVQFISKIYRNEILRKAKEKNLTSAIINPRLQDVPIYFNEHLAPENKRLFFQSRKFKAENNFKYCWSREGKIFLRQNESSRVFRIQKIEDLENVLST